MYIYIYIYIYNIINNIKTAGKYDQQLYDEANQWIFDLTGKKCESLTCGTDFHEFLKDGTVLCEVINAIVSDFCFYFVFFF